MLRRIKTVLMMLMLVINVGMAQTDSMAITDRLDSIANEQLMIGVDSDYTDVAAQPQSLHQQLKTKFIEGNAGFMGLVALALVLGLAFCIERIIYLSLSHINAKKLMTDIDKKVEAGDIEGAKELCRNTRGPVASICYQGLMRIDDSIDEIERSIASYGSVQSANLEKGCSWITLFIAIAPSLGFLGTVLGMVMAFDQIQMAGDLNESGTHHHHLRYHRGTDSASVLQLYSLQDRASGEPDGRVGNNNARHHHEV